MQKFNVAVVGAGMVGVEMLRVLRQRRFPVAELRVLARSNRIMEVDGEKFQVSDTTPEAFKGIDFALFAGTEGEKGAAVTFGKAAVEQGAVVIDNGADFRLKDDVPLVVPEVNAEDLKWHKGIIANPNCSTVQMVVALNPLHKAATLKRVIVSTYQAVSGSGSGGPRELEAEAKAWAAGQTIDSALFKTYSKQIAFNAIPHISRFEEMDYTNEEWKMVRETHKIMHVQGLPITPTTVRIPAFNVHSETIYVETERKLTADEARQVLAKAPGIKVIDERRPTEGDPNERTYPTPLEVHGTDEVYVGRVREDPFIETGLSLWIAADNVRKGAALNAVQIAEKIIEMGLVKGR